MDAFFRDTQVEIKTHLGMKRPQREKHIVLIGKEDRANNVPIWRQA